MVSGHRVSKNKKHFLEIHELLTAIQAVKDIGLPINSVNIAEEAGVDASIIIGNSDFMKLLNDAAATDGKFEFQIPHDETAEIMSLDNLGKFLSAEDKSPGHDGEVATGNSKQSDHQSAVLSVFSALEATNPSSPSPNPSPSFDTADDQSITIAPGQGARFAKISSQFDSAQSTPVASASASLQDPSGAHISAPAQLPSAEAESTSVATFRTPPQNPPNWNAGATPQSPPVGPTQSHTNQSVSDFGDRESLDEDVVQNQKLEIESKNEQIQLLSNKLDEVCASLVGMQIEKQGLYHHLADIESLNRNLIARLTTLEDQMQLKVSQEDDVKRIHPDEIQAGQQRSDNIHTLEARIDTAHADLEGRLKDVEESIRAQPTQEGETKGETKSEDLEQVKLQLVNHFQRLNAAIENVNVSLHKRIRDLENQAKGARSQKSDLKKSGVEVKDEILKQPQELTPELETVVREEVKNEISKRSQELTPELEAVVKEEVKNEVSNRSQEMKPELEAVVREEVKNEISKRSQEMKPEIEAVVKEEVENEVLKRSLELTTEIGTVVKEEIGIARNELSQRSEELTAGFETVKAELGIAKNELSQRSEELASSLEAMREDVGIFKNDLSQSAQQLASGLDAVREEFGIVKDELSQSAKELTSGFEIVKEEVVIVKTAFSQSVQKLASSLEAVKGEVGTVKDELSQSAQELTSGVEAVRADLGTTKNELSQRSAELESGLKTVGEEFEVAKNDFQQRSQELNSNLETAKEEFVTVKDWVNQRFHESESVLEGVLEEINRVSDVGQELGTGLEMVKADLELLKTQLADRTNYLMRGLESLIEEMATTHHSVFERTDEMIVENNQFKDQLSKLESNHDNLNREILSQELSFLSLKKPLEKLQQAVMTISLQEDGTTVRELNARVTELQDVLAALNDHAESPTIGSPTDSEMTKDSANDLGALRESAAQVETEKSKSDF